jgi:di/tricarboxylate transporter
MPADLSPHALAAMLLTLTAFYLFSREKLPIETSSVLIIATLAIGFNLFPYDTADGPLRPTEFFLGFGNEALVAICALMMASQGLVRTGALAPMGRIVARLWSINRTLALGAVLLLTVVLSAFMNNTPQVVLMIPILMSVAQRSGVPASSTLMPMTFAAQIGGMATPIGTSLNLLVIGTAASLGVTGFTMFEFIVPVAIAASLGLVYLLLIAPRILPVREGAVIDSSPRVFDAYLSVQPDTATVGATLAEALHRTGNEMTVRNVVRAPGLAITPLPDVMLEAGDQLVVRDTPQRLMEFATVLGARLYSGETLVDAQHPLAAPDQKMAELVVTQGSPLDGRTLDRVDLDERYQLVPLAVHRAGTGEIAATGLRSTQLGIGDVLLVQGPADKLAELKRSGDLLVLDATDDLPHSRKAPLALAIMAAIILAASLQIAPIAIAALCGVVLMVLSGCLKWQEATRTLDSSMIMLTVASLALSLALVETGAAAFLAERLVDLSFNLPPAGMLSGLMLLMALLGNVVSNSAAAVIGTPIAVELARQLGLAPEPFVLAVLFGVNMGYATPMADNCNLLVYSAGGYAFRDFARAGLPLLILMWLALSWLLPQFFPPVPVAG